MSEMNQPMNKRRLTGVVLLALACVLLVMAYQSVTTDQYKLYAKNYPYYVSEAEECRALQEGELGEYYAYLAKEWEGTAALAKNYLTQHRIGAGSLAVVSLLAVGMGVAMLVDPAKRRKAKQPVAQEQSRSGAPIRLSAPVTQNDQDQQKT